MKKLSIIYFTLLLTLPHLQGQHTGYDQVVPALEKVVDLWDSTKEQEAFNLLEQKIKEASNKEQITHALLLKGKLLLEKWQIDSSLNTYKRAAAFSEQTDLHRQTSYAYSVLGEINRMRGKDSIALVYNRKCAYYANLAGDQQKYSSRLTLMGYNFKELGQTDSAYHYFKEAIRIKEAIADSARLSIAYEAMAYFYQEQEFREESIDYFLLALQISRERGQSYIVVNSMNNIAHLLVESGYPQKARSYAEEALILADSLELELFQGHIWACKGSIAEAENNYEAARENHMKALSIYEKLGRTPKILDQFVRLTQLHYSHDQLVLARQFLVKGKSLADTLNNVVDQMTLRLLEAKIQLKEGKLKESLSNFKSLSTEVILSDDLAFQQAIAEGIVVTAEKLGNYQQALQAAKKASQLRDSIYQRRKDKATQQLEAIYQRNRQEAAITSLTHQNDIARLKLRSNQRQKVILIVLALVTFLGMALAFYLFYTIRKSARQLVSKNAIIEIALSEKDLLLREIHHRVKNNLQIVSSLLKLQSRYIKDPNAISAINDGRTRVRSMALIHQDLYQRENLTGVKVKPYFSKLLEELFATYKVSESKVELVTDIDDLNLDVDTVVPLGLVMNELVSNALKYGFTGISNGRLYIKLVEIKDKLLLQVEDNGPGINNLNAFDNSDTFGFRLVRAFSEKLKATIQLDNTNGTCVALLILSYKKVH